MVELVVPAEWRVGRLTTIIRNKTGRFLDGTGAFPRREIMTRAQGAIKRIRSRGQ